jgi:mannose-6-phosphate isomerase-like protein (cupin superfamily)
MKRRTIKHKGNILAIVFNLDKINEPLNFLSPEDFNLQVGIHNPRKDYIAEAHEHLPFKKIDIKIPQEIFYVQKGKIIISLYFNDKIVNRIEMKKNDLMIANAGHKVKIFKNTKLLEIKQGPYRGKDKEKRMIK